MCHKSSQSSFSLHSASLIVLNTFIIVSEVISCALPNISFILLDTGLSDAKPHCTAIPAGVRDIPAERTHIAPAAIFAIASAPSPTVFAWSS